jgi:hypothetical protein
VARATIAIDGTRHIPLRVQVFAKGYTSPAFQIGFTSINFSRPDASRFQFTPPPGAKVTQSQPGTDTKTAPDKTAARSTVIGKGWTAVYVTRADLATALGGSTGPSDGRSTAGQAGALLNMLPPVSGASGTERLLKARLFSVLVTGDGRVLVGAVNGQRLIAVAADPAAALK